MPTREALRSNFPINISSKGEGLPRPFVGSATLDRSKSPYTAIVSDINGQPKEHGVILLDQRENPASVADIIFDPKTKLDENDAPQPITRNNAKIGAKIGAALLVGLGMGLAGCTGPIETTNHKPKTSETVHVRKAKELNPDERDAANATITANLLIQSHRNAAAYDDAHSDPVIPHAHNPKTSKKESSTAYTLNYDFPDKGNDRFITVKSNAGEDTATRFEITDKTVDRGLTVVESHILLEWKSAGWDIEWNANNTDVNGNIVVTHDHEKFSTKRFSNSPAMTAADFNSPGGIADVIDSSLDFLIG